ncbi:MAG: aminomethyl-transferring glycine dehydrogenase subunit GcvPB [Gammaproteobacteria bacterium]|nr:MAG: aminomethyl-transferring glycine dehydrogenase subunit GcvPB [Gammaproteobacteria bacterium]
MLINQYHQNQPIKYPKIKDLPRQYARDGVIGLPNISEPQVVRHYTRLSVKNFSIDGNFYPLGSCTMKYNPKVCHSLASLPEFADIHPQTPENLSQGTLEILYNLQEDLKQITNMDAVSLAPAAGSQGELAGCLIIKKYFADKNETIRTQIIIPDAAHGTNPASAKMAGFDVIQIPTCENGDLKLDDLKQAISEKTAAIMLTNPSTLGLFEPNIIEISKTIHAAGALLYYDGANLNAIMGKTNPAIMGFDIIHTNLHKTFATPHGGGGPGAGPIAVCAKLKDYLPNPVIIKKDGEYHKADNKNSIGKLTANFGNVGVLIRAYIYIKLCGNEGLKRVSEIAVLNANYLKTKLEQAGFDIFQPKKLCSHEFIISFNKLKKETGVTAFDIAKRLLDYNIHPPTVYFPSLVPECFLIEPTETESKQELDNFVEIMIKINEEAQNNPDLLKNAPNNLKLKRLDELKAAKELNLRF